MNGEEFQSVIERVNDDDTTGNFQEALKVVEESKTSNEKSVPLPS
jgi:hypothetical protein